MYDGVHEELETRDGICERFEVNRQVVPEHGPVGSGSVDEPEVSRTLEAQPGVADGCGEYIGDGQGCWPGEVESRPRAGVLSFHGDRRSN